MKNRFWEIAIVLSLIVVFTACKTSEKTVYGIWGNGSPVLTFKQDNSFLYFVSNFDSNHNKIAVDTIKGTWSFSNNSIYLNFENSGNEIFFGGCKSIQMSSSLLTKRKLIRSNSCLDHTPRRPLFYSKIKE